MDKSNKKKKNKRIIFFVVIPLLLVLLGVLVVFSIIKKTNEDLLKNQLPDGDKAILVERRKIVNSISGTGSLVSRDNESPKSDGIGMPILSINVSVGDVVSQGDIIATLDPKDLIEERDDLKERISGLLVDKLSYHETYNDSQARQEDLRKEREDSINKSIEDAKAELKTAEDEYEATRLLYNEVIELTDPASRLRASQLEYEMENRKENIDSINERINSLNDALESLDETEDLFDSKRALSQYDRSIDQSVESLNDQIESLNKRINADKIYAGMSGTVTSVSATAGSTYYGQTICEIEGTDNFLIESNIDEYDIPDVKLGQKVYMKTEATREEELIGEVVFISPKAGGSSGSSITDLFGAASGADLSALAGGSFGGDLSSFTGGSNSASYLVKIALKTKNERLRLGMNVKLSIVTVEEDDALSVPYDAVRERDDGTKYVKIIEGYDPDDPDSLYDDDNNPLFKIREEDVSVGVEGTYYVQLKTGRVKEGEYVLVPSGNENSTVDDLINMIGSAAGS